MAAAAVDHLVDDELDCDISDFEAIQALDLDVSSADDELYGGTACCYSAVFSDADIVSHCRHDCEDGDGDSGAAAATCRWLLSTLEEEEEAGSSSPDDSGVTDDGTLASPEAGDAADKAMSAYVAEVERFLLDDDDAPCGEQAEDILGVVDDYFAGDQLLIATAEVVPAAGRAEQTADARGEEEENGSVLAAAEDEQSTLRKRARKLSPWGELEVMNLTMTHQIQVPAAPWPQQALLLPC